MATWTTLKVLEWTAKKFAEKGLASARLDAEVLLAHALGSTRVALYTGFDQPLEESELAAFRDLVRRRLAGEPVAYLIGKQEFWSLSLAVDARVLVPRRDTETLVERGLAAAKAAGRAELAVLDLCTGSGAVALALAKELPQATVHATDVSADALAVARANAGATGLGARVIFHEGDLFAALPAGAPRFDLIVSNPPYIPARDIAGLAAEVKCEPWLALDGGADGLDVLRKLVAAAPAHMAPGATLAVEHGFDQGPAVRSLFQAAGLAQVESVRDLGGHERVTAGIR